MSGRSFDLGACTLPLFLPTTTFLRGDAFCFAGLYNVRCCGELWTRWTAQRIWRAVCRIGSLLYPSLVSSGVFQRCVARRRDRRRRSSIPTTWLFLPPAPPPYSTQAMAGLATDRRGACWAAVSLRRCWFRYSGWAGCGITRTSVLVAAARD